MDHDYPGWLVWGKEFPAYEVNPKKGLQFDEVESNARRTIANLLDREWFRAFFGYLKQEPRDGSPDRFRMASSMLLQFVFELVRDGLTSVTYEQIKEETEAVFEDGSDKHQHRATAEILGALVNAYRDSAVENRDMMWAHVFPIVKGIFEDGLTPENASYWSSFLHLVLVRVAFPSLWCPKLLTLSTAGERSEALMAHNRMVDRFPIGHEFKCRFQRKL